MCIFHKWKVIKLYKYFDISWGGREAMTMRIYKCEKCGKIREDNGFQSLTGHDYELTDFS